MCVFPQGSQSCRKCHSGWVYIRHKISSNKGIYKQIKYTAFWIALVKLDCPQNNLCIQHLYYIQQSSYNLQYQKPTDFNPDDHIGARTFISEQSPTSCLIRGNNEFNISLLTCHSFVYFIYSHSFSTPFFTFFYFLLLFKNFFLNL